MKRMKWLFFLMIVLSTNWGWSQSFPSSREKFVKEFEKQLNEYGKGDFRDFAKDEFPNLLLETSDVPDEYFNRMVQTCNAFEEKRLKVYPEIYNYVFSVAKFVQTGQSKESYQAWHTAVDKQLDSRNVKKIKDFMEFSAGFLSVGMISESSNFAWFYLNGDFEVEYDKKVNIKLMNGNLVCRAISNSGKTRGQAVDSLVVYGTSGDFDPVLKKWDGAGGKVDWQKVGLDGNTTYATLSNYKASLKSASLRVDTVSMTTPYFSNPIKGSLSEGSYKTIREEDKIYPQFLSFKKDLVIKDIAPEVDYVGGFSMKGEKFIGAGTAKNLASITIKKSGAPFMQARAQEIFISPKKVSVNEGKLSLYLSSGDSISHPGINLDYDLDKKEVLLIRTRRGIGQAPFQDSYHKLDIYVPKISWEIGGDVLGFTYDFGTSREQRAAVFESQAYFDAELYDRLQGLESVHPLVALSKYSYKYDKPVMTKGEAASALGRAITQVESTLLSLSSLGFISYDSDLNTVTINPKLETFVKAKIGKIDYDNIIFTSDLRTRELQGYSREEIEKDPYLKNLDELFKKQNEERRLMKNFAVLNLATLELDMEAVDRVVISANKNTVVFPENGKVKVKQNRDFVYEGWTNAGKLEVDAALASFNYDEFKIKLQKTNESLFRVRPMDKTHGTKGIAMKSSLYGVTGDIFIDDTDNRAGIKKGKEDFPKLVAVNKSKIYYNSDDIYRGVYDSARFYYTVDPFEMDSLNIFEEAKLRLEGELVSAGIFPKIRQELRIMPDYSFGFSMITPKGGYTFYGTEAKYDNKIVLSNNGLQGSGTINFVHSTSKSNILSFLPDSTVGYAQFENKKVATGVPFPDVKGEKAYITYVPKQNVLKAASTPQSDLVFFDKEAELRGMVTIRPEGMRGNGLMTFKNANLISKNFKYTNVDVDADTSAFRLKNESTDVSENALAFKSDNVKSHVSFKDRIGQFYSNEGESRVDFPVNQYMAKMDQFKWFMDELVIEMEKKDDADVSIEAGVDLAGSNFFSTHPKQDSLNFRAPRARFDAKTKAIYCSKIDYIDIADARISPDSMKITIRKKAKMDVLKNATIVANYVTKYHRFERANVEITARRAYTAEGEYPYYDVDSNVTYIAMKNIGLDTSYQTRASGKILAEQNFKLSKEFDYYGDVAIRASNPLISFAGATRINHGCDKFDRNWMAFKSEIDPRNIQIPVVSEMKDLEGNPISAGIVWRDSPTVDSISLYPTFLSALVSPDDPIVMTSNGYLQYDSGSKEFQIASKDKLINRGEKGNYIALHTESCSMNGDGVIDLGMDFGDVEVETVGIVNYNQTTGKTDMNITARINMPVDKGAMQDVADRINAIEGLQPMDFNSTTIENALVEWDGIAAADKFKEEYVQEGKVKRLPNGLENTMTITGIRLSSYDSERNPERGLITNVESAVLVGIYGKPIMKYIPLKAFFQQTYSGGNSDAFTISMSIPGGGDYFFNYKMEGKKDGTLNILTGDGEFSAAINEIKEDKRKKRNFNYQITTNSVYKAQLMRLFEE
ncbi:MAG: hypothetical protein HWE22_17800 [Flavobacteriales bacterium]|nr:hypothetical protein [Flavobacteriales bacterium]